jgi:hypothetical protein
MASRMRTRGNRAGRRRGGGRSTPGGAAGLVNRVTGMLGRGGGGRGAGGRGRRGGAGTGGLANRATSFVRGFMSGGSASRRGRGRRRY